MTRNVDYIQISVSQIDDIVHCKIVQVRTTYNLSQTCTAALKQWLTNLKNRK